MRKVQFGCGANRLDGWENYDYEVDITKPLPFENESVDVIFTEHCVEHITVPEAFSFFEECFRILRKSNTDLYSEYKNGLIRICVPDITRVNQRINSDYLIWLKKAGFGDGSLNSAIKNLAVNHGHKALWTQELLDLCLTSAGFDYVFYREIGQSDFDIFKNVEGHYKAIGHNAAWIESTVVEAIAVQK